MPRFEVLADSTLVGYSELETGDPPMGVAGGRFVPLPAYESIRSTVVAALEGDQSHLQLSVRVTGGPALPTQGGVQIIDLSAELGAEALQVHALGIGYPLYQELFPSHVTAYENQFRPAS